MEITKNVELNRLQEFFQIVLYFNSIKEMIK